MEELFRMTERLNLCYRGCRIRYNSKHECRCVDEYPCSGGGEMIKFLNYKGLNN